MKFIQNGLYLPFLFAGILFVSNDLFLASVVVLKMYSANYFYWFNNYYRYKNLDISLNWLKQFVRFTDTGHLVSLLFYFDRQKWFQVAFVVHFTITFGYWIGRCFFTMRDCDSLEIVEVIKPVENIFCSLNHSLPFILLFWNRNLYAFTMSNFWFSYIWLYTWFFFIYLPWRWLTGDPVYDCLSIKTPFWISFLFGSIIHAIMAFGNLLLIITI